MAEHSNYPGLAKARPRELVSSRTLRLLRAEPGPLRDWFERADVVSEGGIVAGVFRGFTSILLHWANAPISIAGNGDDAKALVADPHLRVMALRLARREAISRSGGDLYTLRVDMQVEASPQGLCLAIDVEAPTGAALRESIAIDARTLHP